MSIPAEPNALDRFMGAIRKLIREELPRLSYLGTWEYAVSGINDDGTVNAVVTDASTPVPASLNNLPIYSGPEGATATPTTGNLCYVRFINGDPTRPVVIGNQSLVKVLNVDATDTVNIGASVQNAVILAGGDAPVARDGDAVAVYFPAGSITVSGTFIVSTDPPAPGSFSGTLTLAGPATGVITTGQPKVLA